MQGAVEKGLVAKLAGTTSITGLVGQRIANEFARGMAFPYVVFMLNAGQESNQQVRRMGDLRYAIKAVCSEDGGGGATGLQIADALYTALHEHPFVCDAPWKVWRIQRMSIIKFVEQTDKTQIYHHGGIYRIRVSEEF